MTDGKNWFYSEKVKEHFFNPRNILKTEKEQNEYDKAADGVGEDGSLKCGDIMRMWIKIKDNRVTDCKWATMGCASALASTSIFSEMVKDLEIEKALEITPKQIAEELGGLPQIKFHCSILAHRAFKAAVENYKKEPL